MGKLVVKEFNALMERMNEKEKASDRRMAVLLAEMKNTIRYGHFMQKSPKNFRADDFMAEEKPQSWEDILYKVEQINAAMGGADNRKINKPNG